MKDTDGNVAGVRTMKFRGGMAFLGATRLTGLHRFSNLIAVLDHRARKVPPEKALGGRAGLPR